MSPHLTLRVVAKARFPIKLVPGELLLRRRPWAFGNGRCSVNFRSRFKASNPGLDLMSALIWEIPINAMHL